VDPRQRRESDRIMTARRPTDWMWAQALDFIAEADRMHRQFFRLSGSERTQALWEPPVNVFDDEREIVIVVALPGVPPEKVELATEPGALVVRAESAPPFAGACRAVRRLEIPYGRFERRIPLPPEPLEITSHEFTNGCLVLRLARAR
jgi:HSP20 family molecular chaperone IbpA